jgi:4-hydroxybenzoate polyprenyltransferase
MRLSQPLKVILIFLIESNLFIALAAALITFETQILLFKDTVFHSYLFIIFFATLFDYNLHRLYTLHFAPEALKGERHAWLLKNTKLFYWLMGMSCIGFLISISQAKTAIIITLIPFAALTIFYSIPFLRYNGRLIRLRDLPYLKLFIIALNWTIITVLLPLIQYGNDYNHPELLCIIIERFFFVLALCIPFDIRDIAIDRRAGLKTIPTSIGADKSFKLAYLSLLLMLVFSLLHYMKHGTPLMGLAFSLSAIIAFIAIFNAKSRLTNLYMYLCIDGMLIVQTLLVILAQYFHN